MHYLTSVTFHFKRVLFLLKKNIVLLFKDLFQSEFSVQFSHYLPLILLLLNLAWFFSYRNVLMPFIFDEFVLTQIGNQTFHQIFQTIQAEPHPPGFYLFLKASFSAFHSWMLVKYFSIALFYTMVSVCTLIAYKFKTISIKGLSIFLTTFAFWEISMQLKQDILSFPLFILLVEITYLWKSFQFRQKKTLLSILILIHLLLFLSYINFLFGMTALFGCVIETWIKTKKLDTRIIGILFLTTCSFVVYFFVFGHIQFNHNQGKENRFLWTQTLNSNFVEATTNFFIGTKPNNLYTDIVLLLMAITLTRSFLQPQSNNFIKNNLYWIILFILFLFISYNFRLLIQNRYDMALFFITCLIIGANQKTNTFKKLGVPLLLCLFFIRSSVLVNSRILSVNNDVLFYETVEKALNGRDIGVLANTPTAAYYIKLFYFRNNSFIQPVSLSMEPSLIQNPEFNKEVLFLDSQTLPTDVNVLRKKLKDTGLHQFIFVDFKDNLYKYFDPEDKTHYLFFTYCKEISNAQSFANAIVYTSHQCTFE